MVQRPLRPPGRDPCLREVADALVNSVRPSNDFVCRYGGEEFAIILPGTDKAGAFVVAERVGQNVASLNVPHVRTDAGHITLSIGVATTRPRRTDTSDTLIRSADAALYDAKQSGRNRVATASAGT